MSRTSVGEIDFMAEYARPLPALVLVRMLGIPSRELPTVERWTTDLTNFMANFVVADSLD
jgi:cytochrome P450